MASAARIRKGIYSDSDIIALYMKYRECNIGTFTREIGDFIAHSKRDRGATLEETAYMFSQLAFFQRYQGKDKVALEPNGECGWWLKRYFLSKVKEVSELELLKHTGMTRKQAKKAVKSWFEAQAAYPTRIKCRNPTELYSLATLFSRAINGRNVFDIQAVRLELLKIFHKENIPESALNDFIIGTCIILSGKSAEIVPGFTATVKLRVKTTRNIPTGRDGRWPGDPRGWDVIPLPDGDLEVTISTENKTGDGLVSVALAFLQTGIDTERYFSRSLVTRDEHGFPRLDFDQHLSFDSTKDPKVDRAY